MTRSEAIESAARAILAWRNTAPKGRFTAPAIEWDNLEAVLALPPDRAPKMPEPVYWQWRRKSEAWDREFIFRSEVHATTEDSEVRMLFAAAPIAAQGEAWGARVRREFSFVIDPLTGDAIGRFKADDSPQRGDCEMNAFEEMQDEARRAKSSLIGGGEGAIPAAMMNLDRIARIDWRQCVQAEAANRETIEIAINKVSNIAYAYGDPEEHAKAKQELLDRYVATQPSEQHPDDLAVDRFAAAMKEKLATARAKGRGGWENKDECTQGDLSRMLREHVEKGDPRDVANFCMFLHQRGEVIL